MKKKIQKGFSLMKVFICVLVLGLLAAMALPDMHTPPTRSYVSELFFAAASAKYALSEGFQEHHSWSPTWMSAITISPVGMVASATIGPTGQIIVHGAARTSFSTITMTPTHTADHKLLWSCTGQPQKYMPASCR
jgi:type IV pilus assembly protein PilA